MSPTIIGLLVFACTFGGALFGIWLRSILPGHHLCNDTKDTVKVGIGLVATMTALVLGLVTASAKGAFDSLDTEIKQAAAKVMSLDRALARYGPETAEARQMLRSVIVKRVELTWPTVAGQTAQVQTPLTTQFTEEVITLIRRLSPQTDDQRWLQSRALDLGEGLLEARWTIFAGMGTAIPIPFLTVLIFWLTITFTSFGLFAPRNPIAIVTFVVCAMSVGSAVFLILELDGPFAGLLRISPNPFIFVISQMGH